MLHLEATLINYLAVLWLRRLAYVPGFSAQDLTRLKSRCCLSLRSPLRPELRPGHKFSARSREFLPGVGLRCLLSCRLSAGGVLSSYRLPVISYHMVPHGLAVGFFKASRRILEEIMCKNFSNLMKNSNVHIEAA